MFTPKRSRRFRPAFDVLEDRCVPAAIQGVVFEDLDGNGVRNGTEPGLSGWTVFLDANGDSILQAGETSAVTDAGGAYAFTGLAAGGYELTRILQVDDPGRAAGRWIMTTTGKLHVNLADSSSTVTGDFGVKYNAFGAYVPLGSETLVNVTVAGNQERSRQSDSLSGYVAADAQGNFVVVWNNGNTMTARLFNADGSAKSDEISVGAGAGDPLVAMAENGKFAVAWNRSGAVYARAYNSNGTPIAAESLVRSGGLRSVAMDADGDFAVLYAEQRGGSYPNIGFQRFNNQGQKAGNATKVADYSLINGLSSMAMDNSGNFVVVWDDNDGSGGKVLAQRYTSAGKKTGAQIVVTSTPGSSSWLSSVAMNGSGQFAVAWFRGGAAIQETLTVQRFAANGTPIGGAVVFQSREGLITQQPAVAMDDAGNVVLSWANDRPNSVRDEIHVRRLLADGTLEPEYVVNTTTQGIQGRPGVAITGTNSFVVVWSGYGIGDDAGLFFQLYGPAA